MRPNTSIERQSMPISSWWFQAAIPTYLIGFSILGILAYLVYHDQPPIPDRVVSDSGATIFTRADILDGMNVFQRYGIMEFGSVYGHGAYFGPGRPNPRQPLHYLPKSYEMAQQIQRATD
jgi:nitric oxide reductase subunit B